MTHAPKKTNKKHGSLLHSCMHDKGTFVCVYVCMYVCIYVCVCVHVCVHVCVYVYTRKPINRVRLYEYTQSRQFMIKVEISVFYIKQSDKYKSNVHKQGN